MILTLDRLTLERYVATQLDHFFPDGAPVAEIGRYMNRTLERVEYCFTAIPQRYFRHGEQTYFNHLNSDQYAMFLYFLANTLYREGADRQLCDKVFCLNKALHAVDVYYEVELPNIFLFAHAVGTVIGRAQFSDYLLVQQDSTIGGAREEKAGQKNVYPTLGKYVSVYKGAAVLGKCTVGDNCKISAHSLLIDQDLDANQIYICTRASHVIKPNRTPDNVWGQTYL